MNKILIITLEFPPQVGGIATYVHQMAGGLGKDRVVVYAPKMRGGTEWDTSVGYQVIRKKPYFPVFIWPRWFKMVFQIWHIVRTEKIEIIFINHVLPVGYVGWLVKKLLHIPYIIFSHGTDVLLGTRNAWKKSMMRRVVSGSEQIIFNSESLKRRFLRVFPDLEKQCSVLYPCPDIDILTAPDQKELENMRHTLALEGKKVVLSVARFDEGKGFPHLIRAIEQLLKKEPHLVWVLIGDGPKRKQILDFIQKNSLQNVVRYVGEIPHKELKIYYYLADVFALCTHPDEGREEGLGLVFLEAAAAGLPVVAGRSGGVDEAVVHTVTGLLVDNVQNTGSVVEALEAILSNEDYRKRLGEQARMRIETDFKFENQLRVLEQWL